MNEIVREPAKKLIENSELLSIQLVNNEEDDFELDMKIVDKIMQQYDNTLRKLAQ